MRPIKWQNIGFKDKQPLEPSRVKEHLHAYILGNGP